MCNYWFNRQQSLEKSKNRYHDGCSKQEAAGYCIANKDVQREKARNKYRNLSTEQKEAKREYSRNRYKQRKENAC